MTQAVALAQQASTGVSQGFKNRIINGAMVISQYNGTSSVTPVHDGYAIDRYKWVLSQASKVTTQQSSTAPAGFINSMLVTSSAATTVGTSDYFSFEQDIEGLNVGDLGWGTVNAKTVTLSFQVYSSLTGTFGGALRNSSGGRSYPFSYTISSANTWTSISITVAGDTSGTWLTTNGIGLRVNWGLGVGSTYSGTAGAWNSNNNISATGAVNFVSTNGATFYITGVQFEVGSTATSFDTRSIGTELLLCQRYCFGFGGASSGGTSCVIGLAFSGNQSVSAVQFPVQMRGYPSLTVATPSNFYTNNLGSNTNSSTISANTTSSTTGEFLATLVSSALTTGQAIRFFGNNSSLAIWSAEL